MANALIKVLAEKRQQIWEAAKAITDAAAEEGRDLSADESTRFDQASGDLDSLASRIEQLRSVDEANAQAEEFLTRALGGPGEERRGGEDGEPSEVRQFLMGERREASVPFDGKAWDRRSLTVGSATGAGDLVPKSMYDKIVYHLVQTSGVLQAGVTVLNTTSGESLDIPTSTSYGAAALTSEGGTIGGTDPAVTKRTLGAFKYAQLVQVSRELVQDSAFDIEGFVAKAAGINVGLKLGTDLAVGNATSKPSGLVQTATTGVTGATGKSGAFDYDNVIDLFYSVAAPYRNSPSCGWIAKDSSLAALRKLKDTSGRYIYAPAVSAGTPDTIEGKPVFSDPNIAAVGTGAKSLVFGDMSAYFVRIAGGMRFERSDEFAFDSDLVSFRAVIRADGVLVDQTGAVKVFVGGAS